MNQAYREQYQELPEYNGWTNKPTWLVKLWMDNSYNDYAYWSEVARGIIKDNPDQAAIYYLEDRLREEHMTEGSGLNADMLSWAFAYVNWREIAEVMIEEAKEELRQ